MADMLIEPAQLKAAMARGALVLDTREDGAFERGHIPGAVPFSTYEVFVSGTSVEAMTAFANDMAGRFSSAGATHERQIVVYDDDTGMRAARELWILEFLGHRKARMLHGGIRQWIAEGGPVIADSEVPTVRSKRFQVSIASGCLATGDEICRRAGKEYFVIVDVRNDAEWAGRDSTPCCARRGRIPHAVHIEWTRFLDNGRFKSPQAIRALLALHELSVDWELILYCHRGARSANTYYALVHAGCTGARNYIGSWHDWSSRPDLPIDV